MSAKATYNRVKKVVALQWRGIMVVMILIVSVVYFCVVFLTLDSIQEKERKSHEDALPWVNCLIENKGDKNRCLHEASALTLNEPTVLAVLYLIAVSARLASEAVATN